MLAWESQDEAAALVPELRRLGTRSFLLVTSDYHTRRARDYFRPLTSGLDMRVIAVKDQVFRPDSWWRTREGQKIFCLEWTKTVARLLGR